MCVSNIPLDIFFTIYVRKDNCKFSDNWKDFKLPCGCFCDRLVWLKENNHLHANISISDNILLSFPGNSSILSDVPSIDDIIEKSSRFILLVYYVYIIVFPYISVMYHI